MKNLSLIISLVAFVVLQGCAAHKAPIQGAPGATDSRKTRLSTGELPGDKEIKNPEVAYNLALEFAGKRNMEAAHHYIQLASQMRPFSKYSFTNGLFFLQEANYKEALIYLQQAMQLGPGTTQNRLAVLNAEGVCNMELGQDDKALELFREVVNTPGIMARYESYYNMGVIYLRQKRLMDAQAVFMKVVEENPRYFKGYNKLGLIAALNRKWDDASLYYKKAVDILTNNYQAKQAGGAEAYYGYGEALFNLQKYPEARNAFLEVLKIAPEGEFGQRAKKLLVRLGGAG